MLIQAQGDGNTQAGQRLQRLTTELVCVRSCLLGPSVSVLLDQTHVRLNLQSACGSAIVLMPAGASLQCPPPTLPLVLTPQLRRLLPLTVAIDRSMI